MDAGLEDNALDREDTVCPPDGGFILTFDVNRTLLFLYSVLAFFVFLEPSYFLNKGGYVHLLFRVGKYVLSATTIALYLIRRTRLTWLLTGICLLEGSLILSSLLSSGIVFEQVREAVYAIMLVLLMQIVAESDPEILINSLSAVLGCCVNLNTLSRLLYPGGMFQTSTGYKNCWLLGYDNIAMIYIFLACTVSLYRIVSGRRMRLWDMSVLASGIAFIMLQNVATGMITLFASACLIILFLNQTIRSVLGKGRYVCIAMFLLFVILQFFGFQKYPLIVFLLSLVHKTPTFTGRTLLWAKAWREISSGGLLFGHGYELQTEFYKHWGLRWATHLHSYYLQVIYEGGLLSFGMLFLLSLTVMSGYDRTRHGFSSYVFLVGVFAVMLMWQVEAYQYVVRYFFIGLFLLDNAECFEQSAQRQTYPRIQFVFSRRE